MLHRIKWAADKDSDDEEDEKQDTSKKTAPCVLVWEVRIQRTCYVFPSIIVICKTVGNCEGKLRLSSNHPRNHHLCCSNVELRDVKRRTIVTEQPLRYVCHVIVTSLNLKVIDKKKRTH